MSLVGGRHRAGGPVDPRGTVDGEWQVVWTLWLSYGAFYFCRTNIAAAVPGMEQSVADGGLGLTGSQTGTILAALKLAYGLGQFVNGQLAERIPPRRLLALGMLGSAALNVLFGFSTGFYFLLFVWASNGYCQSLGWTPCIRVVGNWIPLLRRGAAIGIIGTGYQLALGLTFFVAGQSAELLGWRGAFYVPAAILASASVVMLLFLEESPAKSERQPEGEPGRPAALEADAESDDAPFLPSGGAAPPNGWSQVAENVFLTLSNPLLWILGLVLGLLNACRYGFVDWGIAHLVEEQQASVGRAALQYMVLAPGAAAGAYLAGWATDRFFGGRRAPVICVLLTLLGVLTLIYREVAQTSVTATVLLLGVIGFCIFGPQVLLVGTAPADLARRGTAAAAAGFVNFMGYMGAAAGDKFTGHYKMPEYGGWEVAIYLWAAWAFTAAILAALLWNASGNSRE